MAMEVVQIALAEMSQSTMEIVGIEESSMFPVDLFTASLPKTHVPVLLTFGAQDIGFPIFRTRFYGAGINQESLCWLGPLSPEEQLDDFLSFFGCACMLEADDYCGKGSESDYEKVLVHLARCMGNIFQCRCFETSEARGIAATR